MGLLVLRQCRQQLFVDGLTHCRLDAGAAGVHVLDHLAQFKGANVIQTTHRILTGLLGS